MSTEPKTNWRNKLTPNKAAQLDDIGEEISRSYERYYIFMRPHPLQYEKVGEGRHEFEEEQDDAENTLASPASGTITPVSTHPFNKQEKEQSHESAEGRLREARVTAKQRRSQYDLFIDLVMVAFIAGLAETFSDEAFGTENEGRSLPGAYLTYAMSFLLISRAWKDLRQFMNQFYVDDYLQRAFIICILSILIVLASVAPALDVEDPGFGYTLNAMIICYTIVKSLFTAIHLYYCLLLGWLRYVIFVQALLGLPSIALWVATIYCRMPHKAVLFFVAFAVETTIDLVPLMPFYTKLTRGWKVHRDQEHYLERVTAFFTILLGSGIELLVNSAPVGHALERVMSFILPAFIIFYFLYYMYANGAEDQVYLHALRRDWRIQVVWEILHKPLFGIVPILGVCMAAIASVNYDERTEDLEYILREAQWSGAGCLSLTILLITIIGLLNKPIEASSKIMVNNRYLRMAPRFALVIIIPCLPLVLDPSKQIGVTAGLVSAVSVFGFFTTWRRDGKLFEPRKKTVQ